MKVYELIFSEESKGVYQVSLVKDPAIQSTLIKFSEETETPLYFADDEKRVIYSVAMRPNKMIFRKDIKGEPANVYYSAETVEKLQQHYFRNNGNQSTNINHNDQTTTGIFPLKVG